MIASPDVLYDTRNQPSPWPAMVRERVGQRTSGGAGSSVRGHDAASAGDDHRAAYDDDLARLGERIAELAERINAAEAQMMTLIADFDRRGGWKDGFGSCAEWLAWRIGIKLGPARERVRTARALENLPQTADALRQGSISYTKVRALTRVATPEREAELLEYARAGSAAKLERTVRMWKKLSRDEELTAEQARHRSRTFSVFVDGDGMYVVKGRLEPEAGAVLMRAVEAASDALFRREGGAGAGSSEGGAGAGSREGYDGDRRPESKQRRADAVGLLAERALAAGFGADESSDSASSRLRTSSESAGVARSSQRESAGDVGERAGDIGERAGDAGERASDVGERAGDVGKSGRGMGAPGGGPGGAPDGSDPGPRAQPGVESGTRAERYQVMVHCDAATLGTAGEPGRSDLDGIRVSAETSRRMACDAAVVAMVHAKDGSLLNVGRRTRTIPPHIRRALRSATGDAVFPAAGARFTEAHHVKHWADGGEPSLRNTLLLCRRHHRAVHEGRVKVSLNSDGTVLFFTPKGKMLVDAPPQSPWATARKQPVQVNAAEKRSDPGLPPASSVHPDAPPGASTDILPPVPSVHRRAPAMGESAVLSNGAALYRDSDIPWDIEAKAREAVEEYLE